MGDSGGTAELTLTCERDGTQTRLRCAECQAPICPACYVRTPVGLRCPACSAASGPPVREEQARPRWLVPAVVAVLVALGLAGALALAGGRGEEPALDPSNGLESRKRQGGCASAPATSPGVGGSLTPDAATASAPR